MPHLHYESDLRCRISVKALVKHSFLQVEIDRNCIGTCPEFRRARSLSDVCHHTSGVDGGEDKQCVCNQRGGSSVGRALNDLCNLEASQYERTTAGDSESCCPARDSESDHGHGCHAYRGHQHRSDYDSYGSRTCCHEGHCAAHEADCGHCGHGHFDGHYAHATDHEYPFEKVDLACTVTKDKVDIHPVNLESDAVDVTIRVPVASFMPPGRLSRSTTLPLPNVQVNTAAVKEMGEPAAHDVHTTVKQTFVEVAKRCPDTCFSKARRRSLSDVCPRLHVPEGGTEHACACNDRDIGKDVDCDCPHERIVTDATHVRSSLPAADSKNLLHKICCGAPPGLEQCCSMDVNNGVSHKLSSGIVDIGSHAKDLDLGGSISATWKSRPPGDFSQATFPLKCQPIVKRSLTSTSSTPTCLDSTATDLTCSRSDSCFPDSVVPSQELCGNVCGTRSTLILKNLPPGCSRAELLRVLDTMGFASMYDFVYLPVSMTSGGSYGYAFVNLNSTHAAVCALTDLTSFSEWSGGLGTNAMKVFWSDVQGKDKYVERYRNSTVMHSTVPDEYKPLLINNGQPMPFPTPTKRIKAPRPRDRFG